MSLSVLETSPYSSSTSLVWHPAARQPPGLSTLSASMRNFGRSKHWAADMDITRSTPPEANGSSSAKHCLGADSQNNIAGYNMWRISCNKIPAEHVLQHSTQQDLSPDLTCRIHLEGCYWSVPSPAGQGCYLFQQPLRSKQPVGSSPGLNRSQHPPQVPMSLVPLSD